ncbi:hypothetical protein A2331_01160 [Candidatus Falkowbacteria bacterium RIFOXYB2_FULL_34_18]|uniref:Uncharacterized protein n=1 Tax=Candidatus Falkowbacteria bacterium RIFOXYD2_FULL_34_120 TaxID=1798007 RepID=A0A1F5TP94_9BACT|nr:MAG: hypothetical protein A2331_01160 [Candidatus Falkowbacteria bacterium RIFOXYB2_FULL_34_18]OGF29123.1 MAG: hypothetical protein A2500_02770 [Candidatus Falkowbacteria bacterium RIFOXYC12_FULL_34_55]OGF36219.1 MAG: hypothetical protein A2466_04940 [Candidatus Falkowbacteria bacterium RIFOXYC2_FULL_34_220]OGF38633.1 MAG: hypothetical protein A2515_06900 [Candidatus Falkowbacteria bacterium RIFOXYD12_FULL_34_57]OGF40822.1 MAG: hypothetical protein A2531_06605 [Candidatus Falkowbacteria bact
MISILEESKKSRRMGFLGKNKKIIIGGLILIIVGYAGYSYFRGNKTQTVQTAPKEWIVKQDDLQIAIEADGKVVAEDGVELSFSVSGDNLEVEDVFVKEGDKVKKGDKIATVKTETLEFNLRNAYSSYQSSLADYNNTMSGATEEEKQNALDKISSYEISLEQGKINLENTKQSAENSIYNAEQAVKDAKENLDDNQDELTSESVKDAYKILVDTIKSINISLESILPDSDDILGIDHKSVNDNFEENLGAKDITTLSHANNSYIQAKNKKEELEPIAVSLDRYSDYKDTEAAAVIATETLNIFEDHLYDMRTMLESTITSTNLSQTSLDALKSTINSNRTTINTKISVLADDIDDIQDAKDALDDYVQDYEDALRDLENAKKNAERDIANSESSLKSKELSLEQAKRDYNDLIAPLTDAELASARSKLTSASINLEKANLELDKATIISPIDGEVAMLNYKKGDIIVDNSSSDPVAVIINNDTLFIEVNIEEADINKISVGQKAYATFDALNDLKFEGEISFISLTSETSNSGIVTYLVRIIITNTGEAKIREGMTAFVDFIIAEANNVLSIPVAAVRNIEGNPSTTLENGEIKKVTTGFTDGKNVEVINGLNAGDKIIY